MYLVVKSPAIAGAQVAAVASALKRLGFLPQSLATPTNMPYTQTVANGVKAFQAAVGILTDGKVGPQTLTAITLFDVVKAQGQSVNPLAVLALALIWHESGFYPAASTPDGRYGILLLRKDLPGNSQVNLPVGTVQSDSAVGSGILAILSQWNAGLKVLQGVAQLVEQSVRIPFESAPSHSAYLRLVALGHKLGPYDGCLSHVLGEPAVASAGWSWAAVSKASVSGAAPACETAYQTAVGNNYVTKALESAAKYAAVLGAAPGPYTGSPLSQAAPVRGTPMVVTSPAPAPSQAAPVAPMQPSVTQPVDQPPAPGQLPPELQPGDGDRLPVTTTPVPQVPQTSPPALDMTRSQTQTAGASSGGGGLLIGALVVGGLVLAASSGGKGRKRSGGKKKARRR